MLPQRTAFLKILAAVLLAVPLAGCGYHLRGSVALPPALARPQVSGPEPVRGELERALAAAGAAPARDPARATARVVLAGHRSGRRTLSVSGAGRVLEYELYESVTLEVRGPDGRRLLAPTTLTVTRAYLYDRQAVLGASDQESIIRDEIRRDLVSQMLRRLGALGGAAGR